MTREPMTRGRTNIRHASVRIYRSERHPPAVQLGDWQAKSLFNRSHEFGNQLAQSFSGSCPRALPSPGLCPFGGACHACPARMQAKLTVNQPGDPHVQETDRMAEQAMTIPEPSVFGRMQQKEYENRFPAMRRTGVRPNRGTGSANEAQSLEGPGQPLSRDSRDFFEPRMKADLRSVRIHTGREAAGAARAIHARAFTIGNDIAFGEGQSRLETTAGKRLLAHELAHVTHGGADGRVHRWFTRPVLPKTYPVWIAKEKTWGKKTVDKGHEYLTERALGAPTLSAVFSRLAKERVTKWSGFLDKYKEAKRKEMNAGSISKEEFDRWQAKNHGFIGGGGERQRGVYLRWAVNLANAESKMGTALYKLGDALHVAQDVHAHGFIGTGCKPWPIGATAAEMCSGLQDDPEVNSSGFSKAAADTRTVLDSFYKQLNPASRAALKTFKEPAPKWD
jgi:hypothetical protein